MLCEYGCGQEAKHQFKNGKWCCSHNHSGCPVNKQKMSNSNIGKHPLKIKSKKIGNCEKCKKEHDCSYGSGKFCSEKCARSYASLIAKKVRFGDQPKIFDIKCQICEIIFRKEMYISKYKSNSYIPLCDKCKEKHNITDIQISPIFKLWISLKRNKEKYLNKIKECLWDELSLSAKYKRVLLEQDNKCLCGIFEWKGEKIRLQIHHKDGDNKNYSRNNLCYLCPNCHVQTETWGTKNVSNDKKGKKLTTDEFLLECLLKSKNINQGLILAGMDNKGGHSKRAKKLLDNYFKRK